MSTIEESVYSGLTGEASITAVISTRLYPEIVPIDATLPAAAYRVASDNPTMAHDGATGWSRTRFRIICVGSTYAEAKSVAKAIEAFLNGYDGTLGSHTVDGARKTNEFDGLVDENPAGFVVTVEYIIPWRA